MGEYVVPLSYIESVSITESLYSPIASGIIVINDAGFYENVVKFKDFNLTLIVSDALTDNDLVFSFVIHGFDTTEYDTNNRLSNTRIIKFSSFYSIKMVSNTTYLKYYNKTSYAMLKSIAEICNVKFSLINPDKFNKPWDFVSGNWDLYQSIKYILKRTIDNDDNSGYLLFPNIYECRLNLLNYNDLLAGGAGICKTALLYDSMSDAYLGKIYSVNIVKEHNILRELGNGLINTDYISFDTKSKDNIIFDKTNIIQSVVKNNKYIYGALPFDISSVDDSNHNVEVSCHNSIDIIKAMKKSKYCDMLNNLLVYELIVNGDYNRKLGMLCPVILTKFGNNDTSNNHAIDEKLSGSFLISDIEHFWKNRDYQQKLKCIKTGYSKTKDIDNLIKAK